MSSSRLVKLSSRVGSRVFAGRLPKYALPKPTIPTIYEDKCLDDTCEENNSSSSSSASVTSTQSDQSSTTTRYSGEYPVQSDGARQMRTEIVRSYYHDLCTNWMHGLNRPVGTPTTSTPQPVQQRPVAEERNVLEHPNLLIPVNDSYCIRVEQ